MTPDAHACWMSSPDLAYLRIAAKVGFSRVVLDIEHNPFESGARADFVAGAQALGVRVYAKIEAPEVVWVQRAVDLGVDGVIVPHVGPASVSGATLSAVKYPPRGTRSFAGGRSMGFGPPSDRAFADADARTLCLPMIETPEALEDVDAIVAHPCVDGLFVGPFDLSLTSGRGSYTFADGDRDAIARVATAAAKAGKPWWMPAWSRAEQLFCDEHDVAVKVVAMDWQVIETGLRAAIADLD